MPKDENGKDFIYHIKNYDRIYRPFTSHGKDVMNPIFCKIPLKPNGDGLNSLLKFKKGLEVFAIFIILLEKTTQNQPNLRGFLINHKGKAAEIDEISDGINGGRLKSKVEYALGVLCEIEWLEKLVKAT